MLLSIITPVYKAHSTLGAAIESIRQDFESLFDFEHIIVVDDDGDYSEFGSRVGVSIIYKRGNDGTGLSRNVGVAHARGRYVTTLDADDTYAPGTVKAMLKHIERDAGVAALTLEYHQDGEPFKSFSDTLAVNGDSHVTVENFTNFLGSLHLLVPREKWVTQDNVFSQDVLQVAHQLSVTPNIPLVKDAVYQAHIRDGSTFSKLNSAIVEEQYARILDKYPDVQGVQAIYKYRLAASKFFIQNAREGEEYHHLMKRHDDWWKTPRLA